MEILNDGPQSELFTPLSFSGNVEFSQIPALQVTVEMSQAVLSAPQGHAIGWGIPFDINQPVLLIDKPVHLAVPPFRCRHLIFMHTSDLRPETINSDGFISPMHGQGRLGEHAADYHILYADGTDQKVEIKRRYHVGAFTRRWGENCFLSVPMHKPQPMRASHEQMSSDWGHSQTRADSRDGAAWMNWLYCWENPRPDDMIMGIYLVPVSGNIVLSAITVGNSATNPLRWESRRKAVLRLPEHVAFNPQLSDQGLLAQIQLDLGQVISAQPRMIYPDSTWGATYNNQLPARSAQEIIIEYTAHPEACFHLDHGTVVSLTKLETSAGNDYLIPITPASKRVRIRTVLKGTPVITPVKLHIHGASGEYLPPVDRHRIPNPAWFQDYSVDFTHLNSHHCSYINGETTVDLPLGNVYIEISKGFEIKPIRRVVEILPDTEEITLELEKLLPWRERGWVTADTHVHFLSPVSALLEGSAEGVNVVNLLASQWGELMTNVGDFDGKSTWGSREAGGDGEYLVRVGTENRQHVLGHISLLGYKGSIISPMTTGGPNESALGDPVQILLSEWARQCKQQEGLVVLPHFPNPRAEHAATIVNGHVDALEMTSWESLYHGIDPYSLSDWYRYLNCGYMVAAVGGTDKMSAETAVGTVRTYARIPTHLPFTYENWMSAVRRAETFVTYGPLLDFMVEGKPMGSRIELPAGGGTLSVNWQVSTVTVPITRVELVVNGEIRESAKVTSSDSAGSWSVRVDKSAWMALLVRGHYPDQVEMIAAHSSPVMVQVANTSQLVAADALTILEQIEGSIAYLDTIGTRAEDKVYKRMRLVLVSAHRKLHNRMHTQGHYHDHTPVTDHPEHH